MDAHNLSPEAANSIVTLLGFIVQREGGMIVLPDKETICNSIRDWRLHTEVDEERGHVILTVVRAAATLENDGDKGADDGH